MYIVAIVTANDISFNISRIWCDGVGIERIGRYLVVFVYNPAVTLDSLVTLLQT